MAAASHRTIRECPRGESPATEPDLITGPHSYQELKSLVTVQLGRVEAVSVQNFS